MDSSQLQSLREIPHYWIPLPDGTRLAARLWLPVDATDNPVPAILEYIPYRKGDLTAAADAPRYRYLAARGYACLRVDLRGSGDSEGTLTDEYSAQEIEDGVAVIAWIARQPWCSGRVGMTGISWGGFNALQVAARRPPALHAIVSACSTDDRYADDVHYVGGSVLAQDMLPWAASFMGYQALPPDPATVGDNWRAEWRKRLDQLPNFAATWLAHQRRDQYWATGSICEDYSALDCATLLVGGWSDAYTNPVFSMLEHLGPETRALIGPWSHGWPDASRPGPVIGYLDEALRWWDHWLKDSDTGVTDDPRLRFYQQTWQAPGTVNNERSGQWRQADPRSVAPVALPLAVTGQVVTRDFAHGQDAGVFCPFGARSQFAFEQSAEDERCLIVDLPETASGEALLGNPYLDIELTRAVRGQLAVRLCEVAGDGTSLLLSRGFANLRGQTHHRIRLDALGHRIQPGHHLRLAISGAYWPWIWPAPISEEINLTAATLQLPIDTTSTPHPRDFGTPAGGEPLAITLLDKPGGAREVHEAGEQLIVEQTSNSGRFRLPHDLTVAGSSRDRFEITQGDPVSARVSCSRTHQFTRGNWRITVNVEALMHADANDFHIESQVSAFVDDELFFSRELPATIPRDDYQP